MARRLGPAAARRRRHRRFAVAALVLLAVAAVLLFVVDGDEDDDGFTDAATATCEEFSTRLQDEFALTFPEGPPTGAAEAEYLSRAFADTMDELVDALRSLDGADDADAAEAIDALAARIDEIRADPETFVAARQNPFADDVAPQFDDLGVPACGSEFLGGQE